ncbi:glycoside hydrolase family 16 protein [Arthrobacter sp. efr-133-TYG-118]|uniref:glycoside hydrolase family 16 protein n=1 Tax=Arthrobacter sp. efr-133-TYG-118 TaxID=3040279 RepID=UPI00254CFDFB|nr:glycoside hydrolase family 16 protein [Arthrobacter sp. efr-133-TYG-118]
MFAATLTPMHVEERRNGKSFKTVQRAGMTIVLAASLSLVFSGCVVDGQPRPASPGASRTTGTSTAGAEEQSQVSGKMPVGDVPGWRQVFTEDFSEGDVPLGSFPGPAYSAKWSVNYADGTPDTAGQQSGGRSGYYPSKVLSVKDGMLDMYLHSEKGVSMGAAPAPKLHPANGRPYDSLLYGRYSVRFRSEALQGFKTAWLLWPDSGVWPREGEIDYPEGDLSKSFYGAVHQAGSDKNIFHEDQSGARFTAWHTATTEWTPGRVEFFLDGVSIGFDTVGIPDKPMHYILQTESCLTGCPAPATAGHLQVAWVAIWARQ